MRRDVRITLVRGAAAFDFFDNLIFFQYSDVIHEIDISYCFVGVSKN